MGKKGDVPEAYAEDGPELYDGSGTENQEDEDGDEDIEGESCVAVVGAVGKLCGRFKLEGERELRWETERG